MKKGVFMLANNQLLIGKTEDKRELMILPQMANTLAYV